MFVNILSIVIGILFIVIGFINRTGNISMMHSYHRKRVKEEDRLPMGKLVGLGMIIIGISILAMGVLGIFATLLKNELFIKIGTIELFAGMPVGLFLILYATIKYNKGLF